MKTVLITTEFKRIDKRRWPQYVKDFIDNPDISSIHPRRGSKIAYHKFNTDSYPRLVFLEEKDDAGNIVFVIRKFFDDHRAYDLFDKLDDNQKIQKCKYSPIDQEDLNKEFAKFVEDKQKEPLPNDMRNFEKSRDFSNTATTYVFEMEEWCNHINKKELEDDRRDIFAAVQSIVIDKEMDEGDSEGWHIINFADNKEIIYRVHENNSHVYYYLFDIGAKVDKSLLLNKYIDLKDVRLLKQARKGYPDWILYGEFDDWKKLENDDEANLALSDEEVSVLNKTPYPYFVNGLAGSGKSTILYYLFAHAYSYKSVKPLDLIFLSYSPKLINKAKAVIKALLRTNPSYHGFKLTEKEEGALERCFWPFQQFLTANFLDTEQEQELFTFPNHLSYEEFQKDYTLKCKLNEARTYKAAMVWSVIRSFIKGRDYNSTFTVESYETLHKNDRTVEVSDYENIYKIWKNWYEPTYAGKRWDDLDLVRLVLRKLDSGFNYQKYDIIYCDEAQDFTVIENDLILRLSKYTDYDLKGYQEIPIAYAGDPNQTVNPTGFNWKRLKEIFDNTFSELVGNHIKLSEKTLNNNYRSKKTIVEFANSLQLIRKCFLTDDVLKPQEQWNPQANPMPGFFFLTKDDGSEDDSKTIKAGFAKTECIITGADGEYERKLYEDELTEDSTSIDDELLATIDNKTKLYTAISSKGLEFKAVLLYRFADQLPPSFTKILSKDEIDNESDKYELAHFFTKLYIAVSRAKEVLYIADTQENYNKFWKFFIDNTFVKELLSNKIETSIWEGKTGGIELGDRNEYLSRMAENFNPLETAYRIYEDAKMDENPKSMNRAAGYFEEAGDFAMAEECKAYVLLYEKIYLQAGKKFMDLGKDEIATKAFWKGCCWEELVKNSNRSIYRLAAEFMTKELSLVEFMKNDSLIDSISYLDETWVKIVKEINTQAGNIEPNMIFATCNFLERLTRRGFVTLNPRIAELYFKNKQYNKAIEKWDELAVHHHDNHYKEQPSYYLAKEESCSSTSEKLFWMYKAGKNSEILEHYSTPADARAYNLDERARRIVFSLLSKPETFSQAFNYPVSDDYKYNQLYKADPVQFVEQYVLSDFSEDKFIQWVEQPLINEYSYLFDKELPSSFFENIFRLPLMDNWVLFTKLKDNGGYRVIRNEVNANKIADAICKVLSEKNYMSLASCFLDVVFNSPYYNKHNANKHINTLLDVFEKNEFTSKDFIAVSKRNIYFDACELTGHDLDTIKDRLREFVKTKFDSYKKIKLSDLRVVTILCRIYEKTAPQTQDARGRFVYDYENVMAFYHSLSRNFKLPKEFVDFVNIRMALLGSKFKNRQNINTLKKSLPNDVSINDVIATLDKEDALWFIAFVMGKKSYSSDILNNCGATIAKLIYDFDITISDFDQKEIRTNLRENFISFAKKSIEDILAQDRIDIYSLKMLAYMFEVFMERNDEKAQQYDALSKRSRLSKLYRLVEYLQIRALHFYSYGNERKYVNKAIDYEQSLSIENARIKTKPVIEEKLNQGEDKSASPKKKNAEEQDGNGRKRRDKKANKDPMDSLEQLKAAQQAAKNAQLEMAKNLKDNGVGIDIIRKSAPLLTLEDIVKL